MPFVDPDAMGIDCGLARDRDLRFLHADAFDRRTPHAFTVDYFLVRCTMHEDDSPLEQVCAQQAIPIVRFYR